MLRRGAASSWFLTVRWTGALERPLVISALEPDIRINKSILARKDASTFVMHAEREDFMEKYEGLLK